MSDAAQSHLPQLRLGLKGAGVDVELQVGIPASTLGAFARQVERRRKASPSGEWAALSDALRAAIQRILDDDLKEPSDRELRDGRAQGASTWARDTGGRSLLPRSTEKLH